VTPRGVLQTAGDLGTCSLQLIMGSLCVIDEEGEHEVDGRDPRHAHPVEFEDSTVAPVTVAAGEKTVPRLPGLSHLSTTAIPRTPR